MVGSAPHGLVPALTSPTTAGSGPLSSIRGEPESPAHVNASNVSPGPAQQTLRASSKLLYGHAEGGLISWAAYCRLAGNFRASPGPGVREPKPTTVCAEPGAGGLQLGQTVCASSSGGSTSSTAMSFASVARS